MSYFCTDVDKFRIEKKRYDNNTANFILAKLTAISLDDKRTNLHLFKSRTMIYREPDRKT